MIAIATENLKMGILTHEKLEHIRKMRIFKCQKNVNPQSPNYTWVIRPSFFEWVGIFSKNAIALKCAIEKTASK